MIDPRSVEIPDSILELVPESVIRECCVLPLSDDGKRLTLLCPSDPNFEEEKVRFILNREIAFLPVDEVLLIEAIERRLPPSEGTIENCAPQFRFKCPKEWSSLQETADSRIRLCSACQREVYWCNSSAAAIELGRQGKCVAVYSNFADTLGLIEFEDYDSQAPN